MVSIQQHLTNERVQGGSQCTAGLIRAIHRGSTAYSIQLCMRVYTYYCYIQREFPHATRIPPPPSSLSLSLLWYLSIWHVLCLLSRQHPRPCTSHQIHKTLIHRAGATSLPNSSQHTQPATKSISMHMSKDNAHLYNPNDNRSYLIRDFNSLFIALSSVFVLARLYMRKYVTNSLGLDDCAAVISLVSSF